MAALVERNSFAAGEIGVPLSARADLARYQIAVEKLENYCTMVEGGANRRPGTTFVLPLANALERGKFIPFRLSATDYYMLVVNGGVIRFLRDGGFLESSPGVPYQISSVWNEPDLAHMRSVSRGNVIFVACIGKPIHEVTRFGLLNWAISVFESTGGPFNPQNLNGSLTVIASANGPEGAIVDLGSAAGIFSSEMAGTLMRLDESELSSVPEFEALEEGILANSYRRYNGNVYHTPNGGTAPATPPTHTEGSVQYGAGGIVFSYAHGPFGIVRLTTVFNANQAQGQVLKTLPLSVVTTATFRWWKSAWDSVQGFPTNIAWAGQRMWFFRGDQFWASGILDPHDLEETGEDDKALSGRILSPDPTGALVDTTFALAAGALVVGSSDVEWIFRSSAGVFETVTAKTVRPTPDSNEGSQPQIPALVDGGVMFASKTGRRLLYGKIDKELNNSQRMDVEEVTVGSRHITDPGIVAMAWQRDPNRILWLALKNGLLAGITWMPKQQILAPHRHPMVNGVVEEIGCLPAAPLAQDDLYLIVRRVINGVPLGYVELLKPAFSSVAKQADALGSWHVDCGLALFSAFPVSVIFGLQHLAGQTVAVLADGGQQNNKVVSPEGFIVLDRAAQNITVGLPYTSRIVDLPRNVQTAEGSSVGRDRAVREVNVQLLNCGGGTIGTLTGNDGEIVPTTEYESLIESGDKPMGAPIQLFHGLRRITVECETGEQVRVQILNADAMPCQVLGMSPYLELEEL